MSVPLVNDAVRVLGISGGSSPTRPLESMADYRLSPGPGSYHDSAAVLIADGRVVAGVEEERLNRVKHTNRLAAHAIRACLRIGGLSAADIDRFVYYESESRLDRSVAIAMLGNPHVRPLWTARAYLADALSHDLDCAIDPDRLAFVEHHVAHAASAYAVSPFADALVVTLDGEGDGLSGTVWAGRGGRLTRLLDISDRDSLGLLYARTITFLGYTLFDEYKVMGLAPYGDPRTFRHIFDDICVLHPNGRFTLELDHLQRLLDVLPVPRRKGEPLTRVHEDLAAALQETIERATFHLLDHYTAATGLRHLCLAGGVAHNSTMVGRIARARMFDGVFVQPASHDAGCALGAALTVHQQLAPDVPIEPLTHVYWGPDVGEAQVVGAQLDTWSEIVNVQPARDLAGQVAHLIADGAVIGWVQGRSEFGPRALGNRSILADARPASNKTRINDLVKAREAYRPFAPAVLEEYADQFFEMPPNTGAAFMTLTVPVRAHARTLLGAVTHVDGTARVQTVSRATNERFWNLIDAFRQLTGVPVLLNTSFNHSVEPIVDSLDDALTCFVMTGLTHLVVGNDIVTRRELPAGHTSRLVPVVPEYVRLVQTRQTDHAGHLTDVYRCESTANPTMSRTLRADTYEVLIRADGIRSLRDLLCERDVVRDEAAATAEVEQLWAARLLRLFPAAAAHRLAGCAPQILASKTS